MVWRAKTVSYGTRQNRWNERSSMWKISWLRCTRPAANVSNRKPAPDQKLDQLTMVLQVELLAVWKAMEIWVGMFSDWMCSFLGCGGGCTIARYSNHFYFRYKLTKSINSCSTDIHFLRNNSKSVNMHCDYVFDCNDSRFWLFSLTFLKSGSTAQLLVSINEL